MTTLYYTIIFNPLFNLLVYLYETLAFHDLGLAIILLTIIIRLILFPVFQKGVRHQTAMQRLQPHLKEIQEKHKSDKALQSQAVMDLYKEHGINPFSGFGLLLVQLPILIALYQIFGQIFSPEIFFRLYSFIPHPGTFPSLSLFGLINLQNQSIVIVIFSAIAQFIQAKLALPKKVAGAEESSAERTGRMMIYIGPLITLLIFRTLPASINLYWLVSTLFSVGQQLIINKQLNNGKLGNIH